MTSDAAPQAHPGTPHSPVRTLPRLPAGKEPPVAVFDGEKEAVGAYRLFVRRTPVAPNAEPAVYVHGLGGASTDWTDLMYLLEPWLAGIAPDLPGWGRSDPPPSGRYPLKEHVAAVVALIEQQGRGPVHLFGNSLGGAVATSLAAQRPDLLRTLTLVSPALPVYRPKRSNVHMPLLLVPGIQAVLYKRLTRTPVEEQVKRLTELCYADPSLANPQRLQYSAGELRRRQESGLDREAFMGSLRGLADSYFVIGSGNLWRQAGRVKAPTLLVFGRHDKLVDVRMAPRAARTFPTSRLLVLEDSGHVAQLEHPMTVAEAVLDHLGHQA